MRYYNRQGCKINVRSSISPNVRIRGKFEIGEGSSIEQNCSISGENVGVFIEKGSIIGVNSFVNKDISPYSIVGGVPTRIIKSRI